MRTCTVPNCTNSHLAKGLCAKHYMRMRYNGTLELRAGRRERNGLLEFDGQALTIAQWAKQLDLSYRALIRRLQRWSLDQALTTPLHKRVPRLSPDGHNKFCTNCHIIKSVGLFYVRRSHNSIDGLQAHCIECCKALATARRRADPERAASYVRKHFAMLREKAAKYDDLCK